VQLVEVDVTLGDLLVLTRPARVGDGAAGLRESKRAGVSTIRTPLERNWEVSASGWTSTLSTCSAVSSVAATEPAAAVVVWEARAMSDFS